ncbi:uncharacterized protein LOC114297967 [Camellia sinensis]|uniref:uncharacterized protein LOC114297967 n=1 Tax=Camellia sinensis TaxID=4442 RepID=UPI0010366963|nr:uncharacterized protein LOC114297967 [Camellia sinensis]
MANDDWMVDVACGTHNHAPAKYFEGHSFTGRLSKEEISLLVDMSKSIVRHGFVIVIKTSDYGGGHRTSRIFLAYLLRSLPKVLIMDCPYKTNRYRLPLLEIVGVTSTDMSFSVAFAYLQFERIDNYVWVLTTLRSPFDDIVIPEVIVTDRKLALMNAIDSAFSTS